MADAIETGLYLLTPTHVGTGQASGAVDLPIARERHTGHPYLPATAIKGVARDVVLGDDTSELKKRLFGPPPPQKGAADATELTAGALVFTDGHLLAFPVRSLGAAFYWITCPLVIHRWRRLRAAWGLSVPSQTVREGRTTATFASTGPLVLEDHVACDGGLTPDAALVDVAKLWATLLPSGDGVAARLPDALICVSDADFSHLVTIGTPVNARVQLTSGKTTDTWVGPDGKPEKGNLWYEETLPPDCLFSVLVATRPGKGAELDALVSAFNQGQRTQIGGNETVGQGVVSWRVAGASPSDSASPVSAPAKPVVPAPKPGNPPRPSQPPRRS